MSDPSADTSHGRALLRALLARARRDGLHKVTGRIFPENTASLHVACS